jgi:endonuclease-3
MTKKQRAKESIDILSQIYHQVKIQLNFETPFELLVATILSSQCTDARVNIITAELFKTLSKPMDYILVPVEELESMIFSAGFYKAKAKNIKASAEIIHNKYNDEVPGEMDKLLELPGVGRKTANVILGHCFGIPGIVVDTHVKRISNRLALVKTQDPEKIEFELMKLIDKELWVKFTHIMINFGRETCSARSPKCAKCPINHICPSREN